MLWFLSRSQLVEKINFVCIALSYTFAIQLKTFKMKDLTTQEGRTSEINAIENSFLITLRGNSFEVCPNAVCRVNRNSIELGIAETGAHMDKGYKVAFASEISLYAAEPDSIFGRKENEINFGSSGTFDTSVPESYWRTIHAASFLKNWAMACEIVNTHCKMYADLEKEIFALKSTTNEEATA